MVPGWLHRWQQIHNITILHENGWPQLRTIRFSIYVIRCLRMSSRMFFQGYRGPGWNHMIHKWPRWIKSSWMLANYYQEEWPKLYITRKWW